MNVGSVTGFGEILPFWLKFPKVSGKCSKVFGNILNLRWPKIGTGQTFMVVNDQILKKNQPIWSH